MVAGNIPWTEEPGGLQSTGSRTVGHGLAIEHAHNSGEMSERVAGSMGQRAQRGSLSSRRAPSEEEVGEARVGSQGGAGSGRRPSGVCPSRLLFL